MSQLEIDIIQKLSARAAEPTAEFRESLRLRLHEHVVNTNKQPIRRHAMSKRKVALGLTGLVVLALVTGLALFGGSEVEKETEQTAVTQPTSTSQTSSLPNQQLQNLDEAKKSLTFTPLTPSVQLNGETLSTIKVGSKNGMIDDSDSLYLSYADSKGTLYKLSETSKSGNYPEDVEKLFLQIGGKKINASFYQLATAEETGSVTSAGGEPTSPTSYLFWNDAGVNYEISEFGRVSKTQLIEVANSLK